MTITFPVRTFTIDQLFFPRLQSFADIFLPTFRPVSIILQPNNRGLKHSDAGACKCAFKNAAITIPKTFLCDCWLNLNAIVHKISSYTTKCCTFLIGIAASFISSKYWRDFLLQQESFSFREWQSINCGQLYDSWIVFGFINSIVCSRERFNECSAIWPLGFDNIDLHVEYTIWYFPIDLVSERVEILHIFNCFWNEVMRLEYSKFGHWRN